MKYSKLVSFLILFISLSTKGFSQSGLPKQDSIPVAQLAEQNSKLNMEFPIEKVYLHFDKPYYAVNDTLWFKTYITSLQNVPSPLSKIVYVDIITSRDSLVETIKLPVKNGMASGSIVLSETNFKQGNYHLRAYTRWMLNFPVEYFFSKNIPIGNAINKELSTNITLNNTVSEKNITVNAEIKFKDEEDKALRNKKITWEVIVDYDRVARGKGTTDEYGFLMLDFTSSRNIPLREGKLIVTLEVEKNETLKTSFPLTSINSDSDLQFFPQGGELIADLPMQIGFKAIRSDGLGIELTGEIVDGDGKEVAKLKSQHLGMGKFAFTPENNNTYFANVRFSDGTKGTFSLPKVKSEGISIAIDGADLQNVKFSIRANEAYLKRNFNTGFYIVGRNGGVVYYAAQSVLRTQVYNGLVPRGNFPSGIVQLSVLSASGKVLSERLTFLLENDTLNIKINTELDKYQSRQKVKMNLQASQDNEPVIGNFSVSVTDDTRVPINENTETTILSNLLLTSEIEGYIENPNYYFLPKNKERLAHLDLLMLTQGYRRYTYANVVSNKEPVIKMLPEQALSISGIIRRGDGMPLGNSPILLQIPERAFYKDGITDDKGRFVFSDLSFQDSVEAVVNARAGSSIRNLMINVDGEPYPTLSKNINMPDDILNLDSNLSVYLENSKLRNSTGFLLKDVKVEGRQAKKPSHSDHSALSGLNMMADFTTDGEQLSGCSNLLNCLSTVMGLTYSDNVLYLSRSYNAGSRTPVEIYVAGMPVDVSYLHSIQPSGVSSIEVFLSDGFSGINQRSNTSGVVVVNLKEVKKQQISRQEINALFAPTNILKFNPKGFSENRVFYVPRYQGPKTSLQAADNRSTIHWDPVVLTNEKGEATLEYFTADGKGTYRVVVEGIDSNGHIGRSIYRFQVN